MHPRYTFLFALSVSCFASSGYADPQKSIQETVDSIEFGKINIKVESSNQNLFVHFQQLSGEPIKSVPITALVELFQGNERVKVFINDINGDNKDDFLLQKELVIGAGPQAGMSDLIYIPLIFSNDEYILSPYTQNMNNDFDEIHQLFNTQKIISYLTYIHKHKKPPRLVSQKIKKEKMRNYLLKQNEELVYTFRTKETEKRMTIGIHKEDQYLVYRFGSLEKIDFEYKQNSSGQKKYTFYRENNDGFTRYRIRHLEFQNGDYLYRVYSNYIEGRNKHPNGIGILVFNLKTNKKTIIEGNRNTIAGDLERLKRLEFINQEYTFGHDYEDE